MVCEIDNGSLSMRGEREWGKTIFNDRQNFPKLLKHIKPQIQESLQILSRIFTKKAIHRFSHLKAEI